MHQYLTSPKNSMIQIETQFHQLKVFQRGLGISWSTLYYFMLKNCLGFLLFSFSFRLPNLTKFTEMNAEMMCRKFFQFSQSI